MPAVSSFCEATPLLGASSWGPGVECGESGVAAASGGSATASDQQKEFTSDGMVLVVSFACALVSLPFIFGSWCWPIFLGFNISPGGKWLCHSLQFAFMLTVLSNLVQYYAYRAKRQAQRLSTVFRPFGPVLCITVAAVLLMVHPTFFLLKDLRIVSPACKTRWGLMMLHVCTDVGFAHLLVGTAWAVFFQAQRLITHPNSLL